MSSPSQLNADDILILLRFWFVQTIDMQHAETVVECHNDDDLNGNSDLRKLPWLERSTPADKSANGEFVGQSTESWNPSQIIIVNNKSFQVLPDDDEKSN